LLPRLAEPPRKGFSSASLDLWEPSFFGKPSWLYSGAKCGGAGPLTLSGLGHSGLVVQLPPLLRLYKHGIGIALGVVEK
jgi:hypothetical protein